MAMLVITRWYLYVSLNTIDVDVFASDITMRIIQMVGIMLNVKAHRSIVAMAEYPS